MSTQSIDRAEGGVDLVAAGLAHDVAVMHSPHLTGGETEDAAGGVVEEHEPALQVELEVADRGVLNDQPEARLAFPQGGFGLLAQVDGVLRVGAEDDEQAQDGQPAPDSAHPRA